MSNFEYYHTEETGRRYSIVFAPYGYRNRWQHLNRIFKKRHQSTIWLYLVYFLFFSENAAIAVRVDMKMESIN